MNARICLACDAVLPPPFLDLGNTPLANAYLDTADAVDAIYPLAVSYCSKCHLVQINDIVPPERMFSDYPYFSSFSDSFLEHAKKMCEDLTERFRLGPDSRVLEVASNDGYLLQYFTTKGIPVLGVEPATNIAKAARERGIDTINEFFGPPIVKDVKAKFGAVDLLIGNNVLAHVPDVNGFLRAAADCLKPSGIAVFEVPHLQDLLAKTEFDTIYHEHVFYFSLHALANLAQRAGLELFDASKQAVHGGTLRVFLRHPASGGPRSELSVLLKEETVAGLTEQNTYKAFQQRVERVKVGMLHLLAGIKGEGKSICAYGAPAKGNTLLNYCRIGKDVIDFTVDRSPHKQDRFLPGTGIPIYAPEEISRRKPDYVIILPWNIKDEILHQMSHIRSWGGKFIVPIPTPQVLS